MKDLKRNSRPEISVILVEGSVLKSPQRNMKGYHQDSIFPIKLLVAYIVSFSLAPTISGLLDRVAIETTYTDEWNWILGWSLVLCVPLLGVIIGVIWYFRRMPFFATLALLIALWHIVDTLTVYFGRGFDPRFDNYMHPFYFLRGALVFAVPFVVIYLVWRFWPRKQAEGLPVH